MQNRASCHLWSKYICDLAHVSKRNTTTNEDLYSMLLETHIPRVPNEAQISGLGLNVGHIQKMAQIIPWTDFYIFNCTP